MSPPTFLARIASGQPPLLLDAAMGTALIDRGLVPAREDAISWSLARPEVVRSIHRAQVEAGAELVLANTFGARPPSPAELSAAVALARESGARFVGVTLWPGLPGRALAEAIRAAAKSGCDVLWLETAMKSKDAERALRMARDESDLPVAVTLALAAFPAQSSAEGVQELKEELGRLAERGATVVGLNCGPWDLEPETGRGRTLASHGCAALASDQRTLATPLEPAALVAELTRGLAIPFALKPDAGSRSPKRWAALVADAVRAGSRLAGGCCGTGPVHLRALREALAANS